ncbi:MAG: glycine cleavage system protein H [Gemmataceae bacterium]|nr:glycine cleavage system protein H [Gemmataceae bacterium]MCI0742117.1 glycine cleavage system protein H [Gemmataceae bacterium]
MSESLTFQMGKYPAVLPADLRYAHNHMWCRPLTPSPSPPQGRGGTPQVLRFGFTSYAVRLMQDVYFLDWSVNAGDALQHKQQIGHIETSKAVSDLFAPLAGTLVRFNDEVLKDPSAVNVDTYGAGWLFEMAADDSDTLSVQDYYNFLDANWEKTQTMLKGHM